MSDVLSTLNFAPFTPAAHPIATEQRLRFTLGSEAAALLPVPQLTEVLTIPAGQITPIPAMPAWVMGVYNWRGEILWMVDLAHLLGLSPWYQQPNQTATHSAVVIHADRLHANGRSPDSQLLGLVVTQVQDIEWCDPDAIQLPSATAVTPELSTFLQGYWVKPNGEMLACLDGQAIFAAMPTTA